MKKVLRPTIGSLSQARKWNAKLVYRLTSKPRLAGSSRRLIREGLVT